MDVPMPQPVFVVSDGTGETAEKVVRAGLRQFQGHLVIVRTFKEVQRPEELVDLFRKAEQARAMVVTTLVSHDMRVAARKLSREHRVRHVDLIGPLLDDLGRFLQQSPSGVPGLLHRADEEYFRRIEAIEYTVRVDDGKESRSLAEADIVLVGVSRSSKTPLSTYLAHKGYKVGNQPIVLDRPLPRQLFEVDPRRIFALTIDPETLRNIRHSRLLAMKMPDGTNYSDMHYILAELEYAHRLYRGHPNWLVIDVTNRAIEETAATIIASLRQRGCDPLAESVSPS